MNEYEFTYRIVRARNKIYNPNRDSYLTVKRSSVVEMLPFQKNIVGYTADNRIFEEDKTIFSINITHPC